VTQELGLQQQALLDAILGSGTAPPGLSALPVVALERGMKAYRGHLQSLSARALSRVFTRLDEHLGESDFAALAWSFWRHEPPTCGDLGEWGLRLEAFLMERAGAASGLPGLARLDWALHQAERAADASLDADSLQCLAAEAPETVQLWLRPGLAVIPMEPEALALLGIARAEAASLLVWRRDWRAEWMQVPVAHAVFLHALQAGKSLQAALDSAARERGNPEDEFDFGAWLQSALRQSWLLGAGKLTRSG
jgi:Putative DNA-binding domain